MATESIRIDSNQVPPLFREDAFREEQIEFVRSVFQIESPIPVREVPAGKLFMMPGTRVFNRYFKFKQNGFDVFACPIICRKTGESTAEELTKNYPIPPIKISEEKMKLFVYPAATKS